MGPWNRAWIFFVIVAVGLVLSWGQVGRKAERRLQAVPGQLLQTESPCRPLRLPCAAIGADLALVLGPDTAGALQLRVVGVARPLLSTAELVGPKATRERQPLVAEPLSASAWRLVLPALPMQHRLELQVHLSEPAVSAAFPLVQ